MLKRKKQDASKGQKKTGVVAKHWGNKQFILQFALLWILVGAMFITFATVSENEKNDKAYLVHAQELRVLSQQVAKNATEAVNGKAETFAQLKDAADKVDEHLAHLRGRMTTGAGAMAMMEHPDLPPAPPSVEDELSAVESSWVTYKKQVKVILEGWQKVLGLYDIASTFNTTIPVLQTVSDEITNKMIEAGADSTQVYLASRQVLLAERMVRNVQKILRGGVGAVTAADSFGRNTTLYGRVLRGFVNGDQRLGVDRINSRAIRAKLAEAQAVYGEIEKHVNEILQSSPDLFQVREAADVIFAGSETMLAQTAALEHAFSSLSEDRILGAEVGYALGIAALINLLLLMFVLIKRAQMRERDSERERSMADQLNKQNQQAILRLLDEMSDLADGDLTVQATVTEDITGAIADSINFAIEELRNLVNTINRTAVQVLSASEQTKATAVHLADASELQAKQITSASDSINQMTASIETVAEEASKSSEVARNSVEIAHKGADTVRGTIASMDKIRDQIQETSKRIKRLGESSQEIGAIVGLITDIADQTNILALNAAIQAAMAGEAGRGFAVVADEVQRLAERSADATKQIEALIKTIQTDTNEAVASMEQSTAQVVEGARQAEQAGGALAEIEGVSGNLSELVLRIAGTAREQSATARQVADTMNVIQDITMQTSSGTNETAESIGNLTGLANELRTTVSRFKLPEDVTFSVDMELDMEEGPDGRGEDGADVVDLDDEAPARQFAG